MKEIIEDMFKDVEKPTKQDKSDEETSVEGLADSIKKHCIGSGEDLNHVMTKITALVQNKNIEENNEEQNVAKGDTEEGEEADDKAPKKAMIVAMLKKKNSEA